MKKYKGFSNESGKIFKNAYFHGYNFGDRLLEGVMFRATVNDNGELSVECTKSGIAYFKKLNMKMWSDLALEYAKQNDIFQATEKGGENEDELVLEELD